MALNNYSNLQTSIANFLARDDLTTEIVDFIALTEADFNRRLRIQLVFYKLEVLLYQLILKLHYSL